MRVMLSGCAFVSPPGRLCLYVGVFCLLFLASPGNVDGQPAAWESRGIGGGGSMFAPSLSPHVAGEAYVLCDMSGVYHSTDAGASWSILDFRRLQSNARTPVGFTSDPDILYAADGVNDRSLPVKSLDGGQTWAPLTSDPTSAEAWSLYVDPNDTERILISNYTELFFSSDGGASFTLSYTDGTGCHVAGVFFDGLDIFVGTSAGLLVSTDGGGTFDLDSTGGIPGDEAMVSFAGAREGMTLRFIAVTLGDADVFPGVRGGDHWEYRSVYELEWGDPAWTAATTGIALGHHPFFVAMAGNDISTAYLAGGSTASMPVVYKTTDGAATWQSVFITSNNANIDTGWSGDDGDRDWWYGEYPYGLAIDPGNPDIAAFSDMGFVHTTVDGGQSWQQAYVDRAGQNPRGAPTPKGRSYSGIGLENTSVWWLTWSSPDDIFASFTDIRGIRSEDGGLSWSFDYAGLAFNSMYHCIRHPVTGILYAAVSSVHDMYQSTYLTDARIDGGTGAVLFSNDGGRTWEVLHDFAHPVIWVALNPNDNDTLYASVIHSQAGGVSVSTDISNGQTSAWTQLTAPPRTEGHPFNIHVLDDGTLVATYSGRREAGVFTPSSGVFVSVDGGLSWEDRSDPGMLYWTKDLVVDPGDPVQDTWYAGVFSGWGGPPNGLGGLYRTADRGLSWTRINDLDRVESCTFNPQNPDELFLTTEVDGLWHTNDAGSPSPVFEQTLFPFRHPVRVFFNPHSPAEIWVTTFGAGLWVGEEGKTDNLLRNAEILDIRPVTPSVSSILPLDPTAPPAGDLYRSSFASGGTDPDTLILLDAGRPLVFYGLEGDGVLFLHARTDQLIQITF